MSKIYYMNEYTDEKGKKWLSINGDTDYPLDQWSKEDAIDDYLSPESEIERDIETRQAFGFYD